MRDWPTGDLLRQENLFLSPPLVPAIPAAGAPEATPAPGKSLVPAKTGLLSLPSRPTTSVAPQGSVLSFLATLSLWKAQRSNGGWQPVSWHLKDVKVGTLDSDCHQEFWPCLFLLQFLLPHDKHKSFSFIYPSPVYPPITVCSFHSWRESRTRTHRKN